MRTTNYTNKNQRNTFIFSSVDADKLALLKKFQFIWNSGITLNMDISHWGPSSKKFIQCLFIYIFIYLFLLCFQWFLIPAQFKNFRGNFWWTTLLYRHLCQDRDPEVVSPKTTLLANYSVLCKMGMALFRCHSNSDPGKMHCLKLTFYFLLDWLWWCSSRSKLDGIFTKKIRSRHLRWLDRIFE